MTKLVLVKMVLLVFLCTACEPEADNVVRVCANWGTTDLYCGTGFFVAPDVLVTAMHIINRAHDGKITAIVKGRNPSSRNIRDLGEDRAVVTFGKELADDICPVCTSIYINVDATAIKAERQFETTEKYGTIEVIEDGFLKTDIEIKLGFSGGPLIDEVHNCVAGVVIGIGLNDTFARAAILRAGDLN